MAQKRRMGKGLFKVLLFAVAGLLLVGAAVFYRAEHKQAAPKGPELYWGALRNMMMTDGIGCEIHDEQAGRLSHQKVSLDLSGPQKVTTKTTISHNGSSVTTESVITKDNEYIRYTEIKSGKSDARQNFSKLLGQWGERSVDKTKPTSLYGQTVLGGCVVPLADLPAKQANKFMDELRKGEIFQADPASVQWSTFQGERLRKYDVAVQPQPYITFMKSLAKEQGLKDLDAISVEQYANKKPEKLEFLISPETGQLRVIKYADLPRSIIFSDFGSQPDAAEPKDTIPLPELEKRLEEAGK